MKYSPGFTNWHHTFLSDPTTQKTRRWKTVQYAHYSYLLNVWKMPHNKFNVVAFATHRRHRSDIIRYNSGAQPRPERWRGHAPSVVAPLL